MKKHALRFRRVRRGLSLVEAVISLAIAAMLLTAVGTAFSASMSAIEENDQFFRATQSARVTLNQVMTEVRRAYAVNVSSNRIDLVTFESKDISYVYDAASHSLYRVDNDDATHPSFPLTSNLTSFSASADTKTTGGGISYVARVSVDLVVEVGHEQIRLSGSTAPRRVQQ